jgi:hypothetical protein
MPAFRYPYLTCEPLTFGAASVFVAGAALLAGMASARRVARIDPVLPCVRIDRITQLLATGTGAGIEFISCFAPAPQVSSLSPSNN